MKKKFTNANFASFSLVSAGLIAACCSLSFSVHAEDNAFRVKARIEHNGSIVADTTLVVAASADADVQVRNEDSEPTVRLVARIDPTADRDAMAIIHLKYFERIEEGWKLVEEPTFKATRDRGLIAFNTVLVEPHDHYEVGVTVEPISF